MYDIIIIGGGAAGLLAAIGASSSGTATSLPSPTCNPKILILEKMPRPARKIMISGKGRCNFTNISEWPEFSSHIKTKADFLKPAFFTFPPQRMMQLLESCGCPCVVERGNRAFPESHKAADVVDALQQKVLQGGAELRCGSEVSEISLGDDGFEVIASGGNDNFNGREDNLNEREDVCNGLGRHFTVKTSDGRVYRSRKLIIATGGLSYPGSGSTGDGYAWAEAFGHKVTRRFPSLTAIVPKGYKISNRKSPVSGDSSTSGTSTHTTGGNPPYTPSGTPHYKENVYAGLKGHIDRSTPLSEWGESLKGLQLKNVRLAVECDGMVAASEFGDLDFTDGGLEGPLGFKLSRQAVKTLANGGKVKLRIDLKPAVEPAELDARIQSLWKSINDDSRSWTSVRGRRVLRPYKDRFKVLLSKMLPAELLRPFSASNPGLDHSNLGQCLKDWVLDAEGFVGYERCVVTAGGVNLGEVKKKTMESSIVPGLYFCGEILDLDADTGGYNLQTAFCTGFLAGQSAAVGIINSIE